MKSWFKTPSKAVILSLVIILLGSVCAQIFNTSFYTVDVSRIQFDTPTGTLSGLLYLPKGAGADDPRPTIVTTHGYLNSAEMQDAPAIELSKRGFVVLALDMYDHGHSVTTGPLEGDKAFFSFWPGALFDAVNYIYEQPYVKKDAEGNGMIAVSGHSMGGFSSTMALVMDEQAYAASGIRKIHAGLSVGSDFMWTQIAGIPFEAANAAAGPRVAGKIAGHFDEFFFDSGAAMAGESVIYKDYLRQEEGKAFLGNPENPKSGEVYTLEGGGKRVIYTPNETHPWNHFSRTSTGHQIDFYQMAFAGETSAAQRLMSSENQTWYLKEWMEGIALIGFFMLLLPLAALLAQKIPYFAFDAGAAQGVVASEVPGSRKSRWGFALIVFVSAAFPAYFFPALMDKIPTELSVLKFGAGIAFAAGLLLFVLSFVQKKVQWRVASCCVAVSGAVGFLMAQFADKFFPMNAYFNVPVMNQFAFWALGSALFAIILTGILHIILSRRDTPEHYGAPLKWQLILKSLVFAVAIVGIGVIVLFLVDALFKTDFRFWTFAVKTFKWKHVFAALKYMPIFLVFYLINGIALNATVRFKKRSSFWAAFMNVAGLILFLVLQYGMLFATGKALYPAQALNGIMLIGFVPILLVAALYARGLYKRTGNIYTGAFVNTLLMTLIAVANTIVFTNLM